MNDSTVQDFMEAVGASGRSISFVVTGDPPAQERARIAVTRAPPSNRLRPYLYDPSSRKKNRYAHILRTTMDDYGLNTPYFSPDEPISVYVNFVLPRRRQDIRAGGVNVMLTPGAQTFPRNKDVDNMLKFLMDALQGVVYHNDVTITKAVVSKLFSEDAESAGWTEVRFSSSSHVPALAEPGVWV
jgi:Holliday junction resolvase RusA-like endonuclease